MGDEAVGQEEEESESLRQRQEESQSLEPPVDESKLEQVESYDGFAGLRQTLKRFGDERDHWAGIPMPLEDIDLVIEPTYPYAGLSSVFSKAKAKTETETEAAGEVRVRNSFWSVKYRCRFVIAEKDSKIWARPVISGNRATIEFNTLIAADAWGIEQESRALQLLARFLPHHQFKRYLLVGMFPETSKRSGVSYIFRRLRPTVALRPSPRGDHMHVLCTLCMHPIAYYSESWAGAMCPTDDVIAHLMMMRGDEVMFWRRSEQHPAIHPQSGL